MTCNVIVKIRCADDIQAVVVMSDNQTPVLMNNGDEQEFVVTRENTLSINERHKPADIEG